MRGTEGKPVIRPTTISLSYWASPSKRLMNIFDGDVRDRLSPRYMNISDVASYTYKISGSHLSDSASLTGYKRKVKYALGGLGSREIFVLGSQVLPNPPPERADR